MEKAADTELDLESRTFAKTVNVPAEVGVPPIIPVAELSLSPLGSCPPVCDHEYGGTPPAATSVTA
jgi:hypothetical protein